MSRSDPFTPVPGRRRFLQSIAAIAGSAGLGREVGAAAGESGSLAPTPAAPADDRRYWVETLVRVATPVLQNAADGRLKQAMPVEGVAAVLEERRAVTHLEALGRTLAGVAPWLAGSSGSAEEQALRAKLRAWAARAIANATDPASPDALNFTTGAQPLVDAAFLAHAIVRAPAALWDPLDGRTRQQVIARLTETRTIQPGFSNWLLFSAIVEAALARVGAPWDKLRVDYALRQHDEWYKGDGAYGDGPFFHWDYYNSFVIHPMLIDVLAIVGESSPVWKELQAKEAGRARRYAAVQERLIGPDGSFPPIGRSLAYRCGAFQLLAQMALRHELPEGVSPAQVRGALTAVIRRTLDAPETFDEKGWLRIGLAGHQPGVGERYISTGSLYLCTVAFLPLGLPAEDPFWTAPAEDWTSRKAWSGAQITTDHAVD
jgi:hypothetical protein